MTPQNDSKCIIGSDEWCAFLTLGLPAIKARVDSGAKTSSIHAINIERFDRDGAHWVRFDVHPLQKNRKVTVHCEAALVDQRVIKSSSGDKESRPVIRVPLTLGGITWDVEVTLTNRDTMGYRMLLGREAMMGRVLIDPQGMCLMGDQDKNTLLELYAAE
ncbi:ATP-dependent zinc protease [Marinomonas sp. A79]|uniref:ATP-dependent zinc protease n=1 Tax=Marinomonas vulgaris TaxID=2823372 RepID=A0ABS5HE15_9GAMM|nr:ATP-dependent zinc protease [Marinomonas vulgaris]MBR7889274.1 ATP-dependent zinc protease [Marinomonas vulgaris]